MADYDIFREQLAVKYHPHGHALWEPSSWKPESSDKSVEVGDVGFIRNGRFHCLFNALRSADEQKTVPEYHEKLDIEVSDHISKGTLSPNHFCSVGISVEPVPDFHTSSSDDLPLVSFSYSGKQGGAVLSLPVKARREDTLVKSCFGTWIVKHIDRWFTFARKRGLIEQMEEIILVTGCDHTRSWTNVAFFGNEPNARATFGVRVVHGPAISIEWQYLPEHGQGAVLHRGPEGPNQPEDQCVFIRGFRVARRTFGLLKHLKAAGGSSSDPNGEPDIEAVSIPATPKHKDPLHILLDYFSERAPDCDMFLIHDDDLNWIDEIDDGTSLEAFQPDLVMDLLRRSNKEMHTVQCDLSHISSNPKSNAEVIKVAMFSAQNWSIAPQSQLSSLAVQSTGFFYSSGSSSSPPDLLIDGYIAHMFGPRDAEQYHVSLLKKESRNIQRHNTNGTGAFLAAPPVSDKVIWVIDYAVRNSGPVIRQSIWAPKTPSDKVRRVDLETLNPPIFFTHHNGNLGLPLMEAVGGNCMGVRGAEEVAPVGTSAHAQIRINWSGYLDWNEQISIQQQTRGKETILLETFAKHVGRKVLKFMEYAKNENCYGDRRYLIGDNHITPRNIMLIGAVQVSQGSWMPILQRNNGYDQYM